MNNNNNRQKQQKMAPQNSTLINLVNDDDIKSITSAERFSPIEKDSKFFHDNNNCSDSDEVRVCFKTFNLNIS
jgi:hypothetical protein